MPLATLQLAKYHEQAQLLDPHILGIVAPLSAQLRRHAAPGEQGAPLARVLTLSRFLWDLVTIRQGFLSLSAATMALVAMKY